MKRVVSIFYLTFIAFQAMGQFGNEWIQFDQPYFKVPVAQNGLYKITYQDLQQAGLSFPADPRTFQLFHRGVEQAILVQGESDGVFDGDDYIEFFGRSNDGTLDSTLYATSAHQPHRFYNLYTDTTSYFLTFGPGNGKRMSSSFASSDGLVPETHHWSERMLILKETYSGGRNIGNVYASVFDEGEGWMGVRILQNQQVSYVLRGITGIFTSAGKPVIEVLLTGRGPMVHNVEIYAGARSLSTVTFQGHQSYNHTQEIEWSDIDSNGDLTIRIRATGSGGLDRVSAGYIRLKYPGRNDMAGKAEKLFILPADADNLSFIQMENPVSGTRLFDVTESADVVQVDAVLNTTLDAVVHTATERTLFAVSATRSPGKIRRVSFRNINPASHNYVIITHPSLRKSAMGYADPVKAYGEYRALPGGGGFDTLIVNIDQVYDQFNFGEESPRAIFQFLKFLVSIKSPDYLFLIGKGLDVNYGYLRKPAAFPLYKDLVPSAGFPASDMAFSSGLSGLPDVPAIATGRLAAISPSEVAFYLNKVKERDALAFDDLTRKKILHLSGGIEEDEPAAFRSIMQGFAAVAENIYLGGKVQAIAKQSTDIKLINIAEELNQGLGMITFFGHSAPTTTDFDIGLVTDPIMGYDNKGKYPFLLMNGCDAGSFFLNTAIMGENWIKTPDKGAVGFIAHSSYGLLAGLRQYSTTFYQVAFGDSIFIRKGIGKVQQEVAKRYLENFGSSPISVSQVQQMVLLGDPAVRIFGADRPDYAVDSEKISVRSFNDEPITAHTDSFRINIPIRNFGIASEKYIRVEITRQFNDEPPVTYDSVISSVLYSDTISLVIRKGDAEGFGINVFSISVDADDFVDELSESNNRAVFEYFIPLNSTRNLYPYNYSIVSSREVDLSFQYTDLQAASREYLVEIDTSSTFNSGYKRQFKVTARVLGKQGVELLDIDTLVYYWRTKIAEPIGNESRDWTASSFTFIDQGEEGWAQVHFPQFESNTSVGLVKDPVLRRLRFEETVSDIAIRTFSAAAAKPLDSVSFRINDVEFNLLNQGGACRNNTINLVAFNRNSTQPYAGIYFKWYELLYQYGGRRLLCGREPYVINSFKPNELITGNQDDLGQYVDNIAVGDSVVLFSMGNAGFSQWPEAARTKLADLGISALQLAGLQDGDAVVFFGRKGSPPGSATLFHAQSPETAVRIKKTLSGRFSSGTMSSVLIGPAQRWDRLVVGYREAQAVDDFSFSVIGIRQDGVADTLKTGIRSDEDLTGISAETYPHLKIVFQAMDDIDLTSVQLAKWLVIYEPVAEGLAFYRGPASRQNIPEGQALTANFGFVNISEKTFGDSLSVRYDLLNHLQPGASPRTVRIAPPLPGDTTLFTLSFNTVSKGGLNDVEVFVNPRLVKEKSYDNNLMILKEHLNVLGDSLRPVIDVTFDGRYLENNDFVSASPSIEITLWDENSYILKTDTLGIDIYLAVPCESGNCDFQRIHFSRPDIRWHPASDTSDFSISFLPRGLPEGTYTLRVIAEDANGNSNREAPYEITFQVSLSDAVVVTAPHPNPFYLETVFDVVVRGDDTGSYHGVLEIAALNGMSLGSFSGEAISLHIGKNRIKWNGTDAHGKNLPDGIYVYRLVIKGSGAAMVYRGKVALFR